MEDDNVQEPDRESSNGPHGPLETSLNESVDSPDEFHGAPEEVLVERLDAMSKWELVQECLLMEKRAERLEARLRASLNARADEQTQTEDERRWALESAEQARQKVAVFAEEIRKLAYENELVRAENRALGEMLREKGVHLP